MALTRLLISGSEVRVLHGPPTKRALPEHRKRPLIFGQRFEGQRREKCSEIGMSPTFDCRCRPARFVDQERRIRAADVNRDYAMRPEPEDTVAVVPQLQAAWSKGMS